VTLAISTGAREQAHRKAGNRKRSHPAFTRALRNSYVREARMPLSADVTLNTNQYSHCATDIMKSNGTSDANAKWRVSVASF